MATHPIQLITTALAGCCTPAVEGIPEVDAATISDAFQLFAHPVRVQILTLLARCEDAVCVCDLESAVPVKQPTVSYHLKVLRDAGLVTAERHGSWAYYRLNRTVLATLQAQLQAQLASWL